MAEHQKLYTRLFSKLFLLGIYLAFFSVQLYLRYTSCHSIQSLEQIYQCKVLSPLAKTDKSGLQEIVPKKLQAHTYLNKRFHPEYMPIFTGSWDEIRPCYFLVGKLGRIHTLHIPAANTGSMVLRGPPNYLFDC